MSDTDFDRYGQDLSRALSALTGKRSDDLETINSLQGLSRALLQNEVRRLAAKRSVKTAQLARVQAKLDRTLTATRAIKAQKEEITIERPAPEERELIVEGRVVSLDQRGLPGLSVALGQPNGSVIIAVKPQTTDRFGHYVFRLQEEIAAEIKDMIAKGIHVLVLEKSGELIGRTAKTFTLAKQVSTAPTIVLRRRVVEPARPPSRPGRRDDVIRPQPGGGVRQPATRPVVTVQPGRRHRRVAPLILAANPPPAESGRDTATAAERPIAETKAKPETPEMEPLADDGATDIEEAAATQPGTKKDAGAAKKRTPAKPRRGNAKPGRKPGGGSGR